jgi:hypothetical protein
MSKDGPPISSGYRHGGDKAMHSGLSPKATYPRSNATDTESLQAWQDLDDFARYHERTKRIGQPLPVTQGISPERATALKKKQQMEEIEEHDCHWKCGLRLTK